VYVIAFVFPPIDDVLDVLDIDLGVGVGIDVVLNANAANALFRKTASVISSIRMQSKVHSANLLVVIDDTAGDIGKPIYSILSYYILSVYCIGLYCIAFCCTGRYMVRVV